MVNQPECHSDSDVTHYDTNEFVTVSAVPLRIRRRRIGLGQCHGCLLYYVYYRLYTLKERLGRRMAHPLQDYASTSQPSRVRDEDMGNPLTEGGDLELQGLLSGLPTQNRQKVKTGHDENGRAKRDKKSLALYRWLEDDGEGDDAWSRRRLTSVAGLLILLLLGAVLLRPLIAPKARTKTHPNSKFNGAELRSNGTHDFKRTVLIFSIDGLR